MPLKYKDTVLDDKQSWSVAQKLAKNVLAKLQIASCLSSRLTKKELDVVDKMIAQILTAPRGMIPEC